MSNNQSAAQKRQVKFSGLVGNGVVAPLSNSSAMNYANNLQDTVATSPGATSHAMVSTDQPRPTTWELVEDQVHDLEVDLIDDSPYQTADDSRDRYNPEEIDELAHTMASAGQQDPIKVRRVGKRFELIAGHRRIRAARILGWRTVKALVVNMTDAQAHLATMVHNEGRKDNCDYTRAKLYRRAVEHGFAKTQSDVAALFATKQSHVSRCQKMLALPKEIRLMLDEKPNLFSSTTGEIISQLVADHPDQIMLIKQAVDRIKDGAPENSIKSWVSQKQIAGTQGTKPRNARPKVITDSGGRQLYTAKITGRIIELRISSPDVNPEDVLERLIKHLKENTDDNIQVE